MDIEDARAKACPVRIITKAMDVGISKPWLHWQPALWPEVTRIVSLAPCFYGSAAKTMYKYQIDERLGGRIQKSQSGRTVSSLVVFVATFSSPRRSESFLDQGRSAVSNLKLRNILVRRDCSVGASSRLNQPVQVEETKGTGGVAGPLPLWLWWRSLAENDLLEAH
jgi:hypothetical protein